jgi:hypothetical protein
MDVAVDDVTHVRTAPCRRLDVNACRLVHHGNVLKRYIVHATGDLRPDRQPVVMFLKMISREGRLYC